MEFSEVDIKRAMKKIDQNPTLRTGRESVEYDLYYQGATYFTWFNETKLHFLYSDFSRQNNRIEDDNKKGEILNTDF